MDKTEREYRDALDGLRFSKDGKERMMKNLLEQQEQKPVKRRRIRPLRAGLIAAALCLVLAGATGAARFLGLHIWDNGGGNIRLSGGVTYQPYDSLSDEIKALGDMAQMKTFSSWQEAEDFIGIDLMNNPVLDASPPTADYSIEYCGEKGQFFVSTGYKLCEIFTLSCFQMGDVKINMESFLYTDSITGQQEDWEYQISLVEGSKLSREAYTAPSGLETLLLKIDREKDHYHSYLAAFSLNGIPFIVQTHSYSSAKEARAALIQVLDGFEI